MRNGWQNKPLGEVCTLQRGFDLPTGDRSPGPVPLVSSSGIIDSHDQSAVAGPGVITGRSGSIGNVFYVEEDFWPLNTTLFVSDFRGNHPRFIHYLLLQVDLKSLSGGTGVPTLNRNIVHAKLVGCPGSVEEQRRIVTLLDDAFEGIATAKAHAEQNLRNIKALFAARLTEFFRLDDDMVRLAELAVSISDGDHAPPPKASAGVPFITISNIDKETRQIDFTDTFLVSQAYFDELKPHRRPLPGDVLYTVTGSFGIPVLVEEDRAFCFQRHIGLVRPKPDVDGKWLSYALLSPMAFAQADAGATGTAQRTVSLNVLRSMQMPKLPIGEQRRQARELDALATEVARLASIYQRKLTALTELQQSLLHQAFTGQL